MCTFLELSVDQLLIYETGLHGVKSNHCFFISMENLHIEIANEFTGAINVT